MTERSHISIIVPCYNEAETIPLFFEAMQAIHEKIKESYDLSYFFVNDGSKDSTLDVLRQLSDQYDFVHYLSFSRNFGKEAALYAGLKEADGDLVTVMDADLQDPPSLFLEMLLHLEANETLDCVGCRRLNRDGEPVIRSFFADLFYRLINRISDIEMVQGARDFRIMRRHVVDAILEVTEYNRFSKGIFSWVGFKTEYLDYPNVNRVAGQTSWSFGGLVRYSFEGIINFSDLPLSIAAYIGLFFCFLAFTMGGFVIVKTLLFGDPVAGWPSMVAIVLFLGGIQLLCLGILGKYLGKIFMETKKRPVYLIKERSSTQK